MAKKLQTSYSCKPAKKIPQLKYEQFREYRNRLDTRARQIRCSVRWEGEEGTGGSLGHPALRPIHPTCIAPIHPGVYIQRKTNIFTGYFS